MIDRYMGLLNDREMLAVHLLLKTEEGFRSQVEIGADPIIGRSCWRVGRIEKSAIAKFRSGILQQYQAVAIRLQVC